VRLVIGALGGGAKRSDERRIGREDTDARPPHGLAPNVDVGSVALAHGLRTESRRVKGAKIQNLVVGGVRGPLGSALVAALGRAATLYVNMATGPQGSDSLSKIGLACVIITLAGKQ
jgi:hypothetical protein